jgi:hypothetical protein
MAARLIVKEPAIHPNPSRGHLFRLIYSLYVPLINLDYFSRLESGGNLLCLHFERGSARFTRRTSHTSLFNPARSAASTWVNLLSRLNEGNLRVCGAPDGQLARGMTGGTLDPRFRLVDRSALFQGPGTGQN